MVCVVEFFGVGGQFIVDQFFQFGFVVQDVEDFFVFFGQFILFVVDFYFFQVGQLFQFGFQDVFGLFFGQFEVCDQCGFWFVFGMDDVDYFVQIEEGDQQVFQQVQVVFDFLQVVLQVVGDGVVVEGQLFVEQYFQVFYLWMVVQFDYVEVDVVVVFQVCGGEQVVYQLVGVDVVGMWYQYYVYWVGVVGFIVDVFQLWQFFGVYLCGDLFDYF